MGLADKIKDGVVQWFFGRALKKGIKSAVTFVVAFLASAKVAPLLAAWGVSIDPAQFEIALTALLTGAITMLLNWIKIKFNPGWL